jgi:DNA-binding MarR family transcriptional regulator
LARLLGRLTGELESPAVVVPASRETLVKRARQSLNDRRRRARQFGSGMFGEPGWDMLLILYLEQDRKRLTVSALTDGSGIAATTALRWLGYLQSQGLVFRREHPTDARAAFVELSDKGVEAMNSYFSETLTAVR